jgi:ADP-heptose:LPS heptosyltransferase
VFYNPGIHISLNFHALVDALQVPSPVCVPAVKTLLPATETEVARVPLAPADRQCGVRILRGAFPQYAPDRHLVVLLNPNAGALPLRAWPVARFAELAGRLVRHAPQVLVGVVGLPEASHEADIIVQAAASDRCASLVGRTRNLGELVTLCHLSRVLVTNDSGPAHFATLTPIRVVALFGPETPRLYGPLGETAVCLYAGLSCSPCFSAANHRSSPCRDNLCLQAISVTEVWQTLARWLPSAAETAVAGDGGDRG